MGNSKTRHPNMNPWLILTNLHQTGCYKRIVISLFTFINDQTIMSLYLVPNAPLGLIFIMSEIVILLLYFSVPKDPEIYGEKIKNGGINYICKEMLPDCQ